MKNISCGLLGLLFLSSCSSNVYTLVDNGVVIKIRQNTNGTKLVRFQVMGDKLIHVSATSENEFADIKSLVVLPSKKQTPFSVTQNEDTILLATEELKAYALSSTGEVWFTDKNGKVILQENKGGGKTFTPIEIEGTKGYSIRQVFESPENEAFYGLGQHQAEEFNYKGKNEELWYFIGQLFTLPLRKS